MPRLTLEGADLHYELDGAGPPLVLLPGLGSDSLSWSPVRAALARDFRLVLPDPRGAGRTRARCESITVERLALDVVSLLDHLCIDRAALLGHSMGGLVAHAVAVNAPGRISALVLAGSGRLDARAAGLLRDLGARREAGVEGAQWFRMLFAWLFAPAFFADERAVEEAARLAAAYPYFPSPAAWTAQLAAAVESPPRGGEAVTAPALLLSGRLDRLIDEAASRESFRAVRGLRTEILEDAAHSLHWDQPAAFVDAVRRFLTSSSPPSR
jgi:pimeloyl-ACP methyl ester carboxylesterase